MQGVFAVEVLGRRAFQFLGIVINLRVSVYSTALLGTHEHYKAAQWDPNVYP